MAWRRLIQQLMNQEHVIRSLEDSAPIRKAAKFTVYLFQRGKQRAQEGIEEVKNHPVMKEFEDKNYEAAKKRGQTNKYDSFKNNFSRELEQGFRDMKRKPRHRK